MTTQGDVIRWIAKHDEHALRELENLCTSSIKDLAYKIAAATTIHIYHPREYMRKAYAPEASWKNLSGSPTSYPLNAFNNSVDLLDFYKAYDLAKRATNFDDEVGDEKSGEEDEAENIKNIEEDGKVEDGKEEDGKVEDGKEEDGKVEDGKENKVDDAKNIEEDKKIKDGEVDGGENKSRENKVGAAIMEFVTANKDVLGKIFDDPNMPSQVKEIIIADFTCFTT